MKNEGELLSDAGHAGHRDDERCAAGVSKFGPSAVVAGALHVRRMQQLSAGGNLAERVEIFSQALERFRAGRVSCGLLELPRLRDPWSKEKFSDRQRAYAQAWNAQNIYTPEFVLNGREWSHGFWQKTVPAVAETGAGSLKVSSDDATHWQLSFVPAQNKKTTYEVHAALLVSGVSSDVKAGENAGRQLKHDFAAIAFTELPLVSHSNVFNSTFALEAKSKPNGGRLALAVWITVHGKSEPVQVTGGWLMNPEK